MGTVLHFPRPVVTPFSYPQSVPDPPLDRESLKALFMRPLSQVPPTLHSGDSFVATTAVRRPFAGEILYFTSPEDPNASFGLKKVGVAENVKRQNLSSKVRYIVSDETGEAVSERDFPMGDLQLKTLMLSLVEWNLVDDNENRIPLNEETAKTYLSPREFSFLYSKVLEINPIWGSGEEEVKND